MSRFVDIAALSDQVLAAVAAESNTKTASTRVTVRDYVPAASALRKVAADLREAGPEDDVSDADMAALMQDPEVMQLMQELEANPDLLHHLLETGAGGPEGQELAAAASMDAPPDVGGPDGDMPSEDIMPSGAQPDMVPEAQTGLPPGALGAPPPKGYPGAPDEPHNELPGLKAASEIRKIAAQLKLHHEQSKRVRLVKAAQMLNAATGLKHLTEGFK